MPELVTVYEAMPDQADKIMAMLQSHGLHPVLVDDPGEAPAYRPGQVRIAVPETEQASAVHHLKEMQRACQEKASQVTTQAQKTVLAIAVGLIIMLVLAVLGIMSVDVRVQIAGWLCFLLVFSIVIIKYAFAKKR